MASLVSLHDFLIAARNSVLKAVAQIADFNNQYLKGYYDPETGKPLTISFKTSEGLAGQTNTTWPDVPLLAIYPLSTLGLAPVSIAMELWVSTVEGIIYVTMSSEKDQNHSSRFTKLNLSIIIDPSQTDEQFMAGLASVLAAHGRKT